MHAAPAYIFLNGDFERPKNWPERPEPGALIVAADGGARHCLNLGWSVHCLIGDFDSLPADMLSRLAQSGAEIHRHPSDKDEIDFELAADLALARGFNRLLVAGALGGRWDMCLANLFLPLAAARPDAEFSFLHGPWTIRFLSAPAELIFAGQAGQKFSILPVMGDARLSLSGARYPLDDEILHLGFSRGLSNEFLGGPTALSLYEGRVLLITGDQ